MQSYDGIWGARTWPVNCKDSPHYNNSKRRKTFLKIEKGQKRRRHTNFHFRQEPCQEHRGLSQPEWAVQKFGGSEAYPRNPCTDGGHSDASWMHYWRKSGLS